MTCDQIVPKNGIGTGVFTTGKKKKSVSNNAIIIQAVLTYTPPFLRNESSHLRMTWTQKKRVSNSHVHQYRWLLRVWAKQVTHTRSLRAPVKDCSCAASYQVWMNMTVCKAGCCQKEKKRKSLPRNHSYINKWKKGKYQIHSHLNIHESCP